MKPFTSLTCVLLALIALLQLIRVVLGWQVVVDGFAVPLWASGVAALVAGSLCVLTWRESRG